MGKMKYEKPQSMNAGQIASILGLSCSTGESADDGCQYGNYAQPGCKDGHDPASQPVCTPTGASASANCEIGNTAVKACGDGNSPSWGCYNGSNPG